MSLLYYLFQIYHSARYKTSLPRKIFIDYSKVQVFKFKNKDVNEFVLI